MDWWLTKYLPTSATNLEAVVLLAIDKGRVKVFEWLERKRILPGPLKVLFKCNDVLVAYWLHDRGYKLHVNVDPGARPNNLEFLKWVREQVDADGVSGIDTGIQCGGSVNYVEMAQWFTDTYSKTD